MPGFGSVGVWEVILILAVLLLVFGARRLPEIGSALGKGIREFKTSVKEIEGEISRPGDRSARDLPRSEARREEPRREEPPPREVEAAGRAEAESERRASE